MSEFNEAAMKRAGRKRALLELQQAISRAVAAGAVLSVREDMELRQFECDGYVRAEPLGCTTLTLVLR